jgi:hypothetical protein
MELLHQVVNMVEKEQLATSHSVECESLGWYMRHRVAAGGGGSDEEGDEKVDYTKILDVKQLEIADDFADCAGGMFSDGCQWNAADGAADY